METVVICSHMTRLIINKNTLTRKVFTFLLGCFLSVNEGVYLFSVVKKREVT